MQNSLGLIKVCPNPNCEAVWHNIPKKQTHCNDCDNTIIIVNEDTYWKKFANNWFQYDFISGDIFRPIKEKIQLDLF
jgi:hypothetical protein